PSPGRQTPRPPRPAHARRPPAAPPPEFRPASLPCSFTLPARGDPPIRLAANQFRRLRGLELRRTHPKDSAVEFAANKKWALSPLISPPAGSLTATPTDKRVCLYRIRRIRGKFNRDRCGNHFFPFAAGW